jgi:TolA-binding protein
MRSITLSALLMVAVAAGAAHAADTTQPPAKPKHHKTAAASATKPKAKAHAKQQPMSEEKRRDLERRIEALEQKSEMQYHEADTPNGAPGAKPAAH